METLKEFAFYTSLYDFFDDSDAGIEFPRNPFIFRRVIQARSASDAFAIYDRIFQQSRQAREEVPAHEWAPKGAHAYWFASKPSWREDFRNYEDKWTHFINPVPIPCLRHDGEHRFEWRGDHGYDVCPFCLLCRSEDSDGAISYCVDEESPLRSRRKGGERFPLEFPELIWEVA